MKEYDEFDSEIKTQKAHLNEIDGQIKQVKKKVGNYRFSFLSN